MEPQTAPAPVRPAPIMDVAPPAQAAPKAPVATPPATNTPKPAPANQAAKPAPAPSQPVPKTTGPTLPAAAIGFAIVLFAALTALAYYAYTKAK